jgi:Tfp pilus assembly protein PilO
MASFPTFKRSGLLWIHAAGIGVCVVTSLFGYATLAGPFLQRQAAAVDLRRELQTQQQKAGELQTDLKAARERLAALQAEVAAGTVRLEPAAHVNRRIAAVTEFFCACGLTVDDVRMGAVSGGRQYELVPLTIVGRGTYQQGVAFLHGLCAKYPDMSLIRVDLTGNAAAPDLTKLKLELFWYTAPGGPTQKAAAHPNVDGGVLS